MHTPHEQQLLDARLEFDDERRENAARFDEPTKADICAEQLSRLNVCHEALLACRDAILDPSTRRIAEAEQQIERALRRMGRR